MKEIVADAFTDATDKGLIISGDDVTEIRRTLSVGNDWTQLLVGMSFSVDASASITGSGFGFRFGLTNATGSLTNATGHFIGFLNAGNYGYAGGSYYLHAASQSYLAYNRFSPASNQWLSGFTWHNGFTTTTMKGWLPVRPRCRAGIALLFTKSGTTINCSAVFNEASSNYYYAADGLTSAAFSAGMQELTLGGLQTVWNVPIASGIVHKIDNSTNSHTVDEATYGDLDSVLIHWPYVAAKLCIYGVGVARLA